MVASQRRATTSRYLRHYPVVNVHVSLPTMFPPALPNEMYGRILKELRIEDLASVSLLNHAWQARVFPYLYNAPCLSVEEHLEDFAKRLATDDGIGPLSIVATMKVMILYREFMGDRLRRQEIDQESLRYLKDIVPRLPRLKRISWQIGLVPDDLDILPLFQSHPSLDSVDLYISPHMYGSCDTGELVPVRVNA